MLLISLQQVSKNKILLVPVLELGANTAGKAYSRHTQYFVLLHEIKLFYIRVDAERITNH